MKRSVGLGRVLTALVPSWLAWAGSQALVGWLVFVATGSPSLVGLAVALRFAPLAVAGVPAGTLSDRFGRLRLLRLSNFFAACISLAIVALSASGTAPIGALLAASAAWGFADAGRIVSGSNLVYDLAGRGGPTRAIAASNLVSAIGQMLGGALAGIVLSATAPWVAAAIVALGYGGAGLILTGMQEPPLGHLTVKLSFAASLREGLGLLGQVPSVRVLVLVALVVEMFGFSCFALDPVFAGKVFLVGPGGLGLILAARGVGRLGGAAALIKVPPRGSLGRALALAVLGFGLSLAAYAASPRFWIAVPLVIGGGAAGVLVDALVQTALQSAVDASSRGRAAGLWVFILGLQPVGVLEVGILAQLVDSRFSQGLNGLVVIAIGVLLMRSGLQGRILSQSAS